MSERAGTLCAPPGFRGRVLSGIVPHGIGVQLSRGAVGDPGEVRRVAEAGFGLVRSDMDWELVERGKSFDFSGYERGVELCSSFGIGVVYILISHAFIADPGDPRWNLRAPEGRKRFCKFAFAAARRFRGRGVVWEIWNEPDNEKFWRPKPDLEEFFKVAVEVARAVKEADPGALVVAPGAAHAVHPITGKENEFLKALIQRGLLEHVDGVSVHPYQAGGKPENAVRGYEKLREWLRRYSPKDKRGFIASTEWGYEDFIRWKGVGLVRGRQARYVARQFLVNLWQEIPIQIYFTWKASKSYGLLEDDGTPKPAFYAARTVLKVLRGTRFVRRLPLGREEEFVLLFSSPDGRKVVLPVWLGVDAGPEGGLIERRPLRLPLPPGRGEIVSLFGERAPISWGSEGLTIVASEEPVFLVLEPDQRAVLSALSL